MIEPLGGRGGGGGRQARDPNDYSVDMMEGKMKGMTTSGIKLAMWVCWAHWEIVVFFVLNLQKDGFLSQ